MFTYADDIKYNNEKWIFIRYCEDNRCEIFKRNVYSSITIIVHLNDINKI